MSTGHDAKHTADSSSLVDELQSTGVDETRKGGKEERNKGGNEETMKRRRSEGFG